MMSAHEKIYRSLLVVYPREHRREYAEPMTQLMRDRLRDAGGGGRAAVIWVHTLVDLVGSALAERKGATMDTLKAGWWRVSAGVIAAGFVFLAAGNLIAEDEGPYWGKVAAAAVAILAAGAIVSGLRLRERRRVLGSILIGVGTLPGAALLSIIWMPPVFLFGLLSAVTAGLAFHDAIRDEGAHAAT